MRRLSLGRWVLCAVLVGSGVSSARAQTGSQAASSGFPAAALTAKTIALVNDTHDAKVTDGARAALRSWGQFRVVDDPSMAEVTLRFDRSKEHSGASTEGTDPNTGKPSYGYSISSSSQIHMKVYTRDGDTPFFTTKTDDSKAKAGMECVNDFHTAYRAARQAAAQP